MKLGATLAHDDVAGQHHLTAKALDAQPFGFGVAAVAGTAACFFVCHGCGLGLLCKMLRLLLSPRPSPEGRVGVNLSN